MAAKRVVDLPQVLRPAWAVRAVAAVAAATDSMAGIDRPIVAIRRQNPNRECAIKSQRNPFRSSHLRISNRERMAILWANAGGSQARP